MNDDFTIEISDSTEPIILGVTESGATTLPTIGYASHSETGIVRIGQSLLVDSQGLINVPVATETNYGSVKIGEYLTLGSDGSLSLDSTLLENLTSPLATSYSPGIIQPGNYLSISGGILSLNETTLITDFLEPWIANPSVLPIASETSLGVISVGDYLSVSPEGILSVDISAVSVDASEPALATLTSPGIVQPGPYLNVTDSGVLSVSLSSSTSAGLMSAEDKAKLDLLSSVSDSGWIPTIATQTDLGLVKGGGDVTIGSDGTLYTAIPLSSELTYNTELGINRSALLATSLDFGMIKPGKYLTVSNGILSVDSVSLSGLIEPMIESYIGEDLITSEELATALSGLESSLSSEFEALLSNHEASNNHPLATQSTPGFLSAEDKVKLDALEEELGLNNFSGPGFLYQNPSEEWIQATTGNYLTLFEGVLNLNTTATLSLLVLPTVENAIDNHEGSRNHPLVTSYVPGFMSSADKIKLDSINTNNFQPRDDDLTSVANLSGVGIPWRIDAQTWETLEIGAYLSKSGNLFDLNASNVNLMLIAPAVSAHASSRNHPLATPNQAGFMSASDKAKIDSLSGTDGYQDYDQISEPAFPNVGDLWWQRGESEELLNSWYWSGSHWIEAIIREKSTSLFGPLNSPQILYLLPLRGLSFYLEEIRLIRASSPSDSANFWEITLSTATLNNPVNPLVTITSNEPRMTPKSVYPLDSAENSLVVTINPVGSPGAISGVIEVRYRWVS